MATNDPAKRIPKSLRTDATLLGTYTLADIVVAVLPGVIVILLLQIVVPTPVIIGGYHLQTITLPLAGSAIVCGLLFVYLTPAHLSSLEWIETVVRFARHPKRATHEDAKQYTQIERVYPRRDALERTDGALLGMVQVQPPTMALATDHEWQAKAESFQNFCNTVVDFPIQLYATTQPFPVERYLAQYDSRLEAADVRANPQLAALIRDYLSWYADELDQRRMTIRDHYIVIPVAPHEVRFERESLRQKLARLPVLGILLTTWFDSHATARQAAMFDALETRLRRVEAGIAQIDGCTATRVSAEDATQLLVDFWAGESHEYGDLRSVLRTRPLVGERT
ncbi:hypothetical protein [Haloplanus aerogenes]|uniref:PrgI family protein n=1 Tax=Haloplanus aerogenes TaxID=660522 RepID=A0A3M0CHM9_9EURY|nr:hypothetical protein [Haloplanus aerogenes]AZH24796.1 hypothetical protein DU502_05135 [Haloplanus aerogenes]RMB08335.1 hypothetical protein ATH50_3550 [Haloplanus aerogenes]